MKYQQVQSNESFNRSKSIGYYLLLFNYYIIYMHNDSIAFLKLGNINT